MLKARLIVLLALPAVFMSMLSRTARASDLSHSEIVVFASSSAVDRQAATMVRDEVTKRTGLNWPVVGALSSSVPSRVVLVERGQVAGLLGTLHLQGAAAIAAMPAESFAIRVLEGGRTVVVVGADQRGVMFGAGYLLRHLDMTTHNVSSHEITDLVSSPAYPVRGHQLGYRPKNNTFDAWSPVQFEQYIRDLAIFGTNTIELIPPRSDDDAISPLFTLPPMEMMVKLSGIIDRYGLDCSIWYPALDKDYSNPATVDAAVAEWGAVFDQLPRIDAVFVPGGDPGHTQPKYLMALLEKEAARLRQKHPKAQMWVSPQSFSAQWMEEFYGLLDQDPKWLTGVVYGPEMRDSLEDFRHRVPARFPIRFYPDITHVLDAQYPVPNLDPAFALTEGREPVNPRPVDQGILFDRYTPLTIGAVAYSEGSNDDVNKVLWSGWGWNPKQTASAILREYARLFLDPMQSGALTKAMDGLEEDWRGPVQTNGSIAGTLRLLQDVEREKPAMAKTNWRFQQLLYRGYYDAYVQKRTLREWAAERKSVGLLQAPKLTDAVLDEANAALDTPADCGQDVLCQRVQGLADDLFHSIGMQLNVAKYRALAVGRGANLDRVDAPLSDAPWLKAQITMARAELDSERRKGIVSSTLDVLGVRGSGQYDVLGDVSRSPHLIAGKSFEEDPSGLTGVYRGVVTASALSGSPLVWRASAGTLYDRPIELLYHDLPANKAYRVEVHFPSDARKLSFLANGSAILPECRDSTACLDATYAITAGLVPAGELRLSIATEKGRGGNGRYAAVSTVRVSPAN